MAGEKSRNEALAEAFAAAEQRKSVFFEPASRLQLVEKLEHLSRFSDFLLLVTGPEGAGKTLLLQQLQKVQSDRTLRICSIDAAASGELGAMLRAVCSQLSPEISLDGDNQKILNGLYEFAQVMAGEHIQWILLVDNAEQLESAAQKLLLQMLSDAQGLPQKPHLLLFGQESLTEKLGKHDEFSLLEGQLHHIQLSPFTETEAAEYLRLRYSAAGALTAKQMKAVFDASGGYPGSLNSSAEALFRSGSVSRPAASRSLPKVHLMGIASVLLLVLAVALWQYWPESSASGDGDRTLVQLDVPVTSESTVAADPQQPVEEIKLNAPASYTPGETSQQPEQPTVENTFTEVQPPVVEQKPVQAAVEPSPAPVEVAKAEPAPEPAPVKPAPKAVAETKPVVAVAEPQATTQPEPAKPVAPARPSVQSVPLSSAEQALLSWPESAYTLQVLGAGVKKSAEDFIRSQKQPQKFYLFQTKYKNKPWFVVVYGQYKDRSTASAASKKLPADLAKLRPWARSIQGIQAELATRK
ncbi:MAG: AAA family ATPase [Amphritea sp.]|nr:AAA family ATPase [Amphritea sp.]